MRRRAVPLLAALLVLAVTLALAPRAEAFVYWAGLSTVGRADLDGSNVDPSFMTPVSAGCEGVAIDGGHIYWARWGAPGYIGRANLAGTGVNNTFIGGADNPQGVAVDSDHIYWTSWDYPGESDAIERADLDGSNVDSSFIAVAEAPRGVAVNATHIYWAASGNIGRANLDGSNVDPNFIDPASPIGGQLAVNATHIYWATGGNIGRANLNGKGVDQSFITVVNALWGVTVDSEHVYWTSSGDDPFSSGAIGRADLDGSNVDETFIGSADPVIFPCSIAVDARSTPSNDFTFGKVQKNKRKGTAKLKVSVPGPGILDLARTLRVRADQEAVASQGEGQLIVEPRRRAREQLNAGGEAMVNSKVTYTPDGGSPHTKRKQLKLIKR